MQDRINDFFHNIWVRKLAIVGLILMFVVPMGIAIYFGFKAEETPKGEMWALVVCLVVLTSLSTFLKEAISKAKRVVRKLVFGVKYILTYLIFYWVMLAISKVFANGLGFMWFVIQVIGLGIIFWIFDEFINKDYIEDREIDAEALRKAKVAKREDYYKNIL